MTISAQDQAILGSYNSVKNLFTLYKNGNQKQYGEKLPAILDSLKTLQQTIDKDSSYYAVQSFALLLKICLKHKRDYFGSEDLLIAAVQNLKNHPQYKNHIDASDRRMFDNVSSVDKLTKAVANISMPSPGN